MKWISVNNPPDKDMISCFVACKRKNGTIFVPNHRVLYTTGIRLTINSPIYKGFLYERVIAWIPEPEPYMHNKKGWILISEREPKKSSDYIVSSFKASEHYSNGEEDVSIAYYDQEKMKFYAHPDVIAWMPIPKVKIN